MKAHSSRFLQVCLLLLLATVGVVAWVMFSGLKVKVTNASGANITELRIKFTGGILSVSSLKNGESYSNRVNPNGESNLVIEFVDASRVHHSHEIDVYFERNYRGSIDISIKPGGKVEWKDMITN